ncbi:hypothetical protein HPB50_028949 [Hyalomma asiaticum]|nr:hypothetical protein HPB50_028949 [Hyalomma asiaticum]
MGQQQDVLQEAVGMTESYLRGCSLACSPEKSELLVMWRRTKRCPLVQTPDLELTLNGIQMPAVSMLQVLELTLQKNYKLLSFGEEAEEEDEELMAVVSKVSLVGFS